MSVLKGYDDYAGKGLGPVQWKLALALLVVWLIVFASLAFGKKILTKVTWVTVVGPIVMLVVLLLRSVTLEGAGDGIEFYIGKFDSEVLGDLDMWASACSQILFSLSPGFGAAITMSSYTRPKENVFRTCMVVAVCNSAFSLLGGFAIFSIVGNITFRLNAAGGVLDEATGAMVATTVAEQASAGTGLAFVAIADGMRAFGSGTNAMSVLFFSVLLTLGLDSTFCWAETFVCYVEDYLLVKGGTKPAHWKIVGCMCAVMYLMGLLFCTRMGIELLDIVDHYCITYYLLLAVALEAIMFTFDFGWRRLVVHVKLATLGNLRTPFGQDVIPSAFWWCAIHFTMPACSLFLFFYIFSSDVGEPYGGYPGWMQGIGWSCLAALLAVTPLGLVRNLKLGTGSTLPPLEQDEAALAAALAIKSTLTPVEQHDVSI
jgi:SNF family Na+-dependent transporter